MNTKPIQYWNSLNSAFKVLVVILLAVGIFFRFAALTERPYWHDETYTLLRASGHTISELTTQVFDGRVIDRAELLKFQQIVPEKTWLDMIRSLMVEEPHRMPLYYAIARIWMEWLGSDLSAMRSLSVVTSLFVFPALYWLCIELFIQPLTAWIAIMLMAVSPFHVYYAQEVREYSLWTVIILVMSAALLRAIRVQTKTAWSMYSLSIVSALYTLVLSIPLIIAHAIYIFIDRTYTRKIVTPLKALSLGIGFCLPWLAFTLINRSQTENTSAWMFRAIPIQELFAHWITNFQFLFLTENLTGRLKWVFAIALAILVTLAIKSLIQQTSRAIWGFIVLLILPLVLSMVMPDLLWGGIRSTNSRYFVPSYLGIQLAVAHWFATRIQLRDRFQQTYWKFVLMTVLTAGVLSCSAQILQNQISDDKAIASLINRSENAIVISNEVSYQGGGTIGDVLALSHLVQPKTQFQLVIQPQTLSIPTQPNLYLYKPLTYLKQNLQQSYQLQAVYKDKLFRILPNQK